MNERKEEQIMDRDAPYIKNCTFFLHTLRVCLALLKAVSIEEYVMQNSYPGITEHKNKQVLR